MSGPRLTRPRRLLERHVPWFLLSGLAAGSVLALALALDQGFFAEFEGLSSILRGYTLPGVAFGVAAVVACIASFAYALRKRSLQERLPFGRATLAAWLWSHLYLGILAAVLAVAHAGYGSISFEPSSGKAALALLLLLVASGTLWRLIYVLVPPSAARDVGNYSEGASRARSEACLVEIEKIAAGASPRFRELTTWVLGATPAPAGLEQALASLPPDEAPAFRELAELAQHRREAIDRERRQRRYLRILQGLRIAHVPLGLALFLAVPVHVVLAYDLPARFLEPKAMLGATLGGFEPASRCASCHADIYRAWKTSMHAHAMQSPIMIAQTNQVARRVLAGAASPDPAEVCVACHGPIGTLVTDGNTLPLPAGPLADRELIDEGVSCAVCHQWQGSSHTASAGLTGFQDGLVPGRTVFGPFGDAVGNAFHRSEKGAVFAKPSTLCQNCHSVELDRNGDGAFERGQDLVLQTLYEEWEAYAKNGGPECVDCHMPVVRQKGRAAGSAIVPFEQDGEAPPRRLRDHAFVGVDYPLDHPAVRDATRPKREALLAGAARLALAPGSVQRRADAVAFTVTVENAGTGHNLPGGFAFVRQMWLETVVRGEGGTVLASSGVVASPADDLCDASVVDDRVSPVLPFVHGCARSDPSLVNFQQMLVDRVEILRDAGGAAVKGARGENLLARASGSKEAVIQELTGGPVPRTRPATGTPTPPLTPGETGSYPYVLAVPAGSVVKTVDVRLLFRVAAPYFLRALGSGQAKGERVRLAELTGALEVTEMAKATAPVGARP